MATRNLAAAFSPQNRKHTQPEKRNMNKFLLASLLASFSLASNADGLKTRTLPLQAAIQNPFRAAAAKGGPQLVAARIVPSAETDASWVVEYG